MPLPAFAERDVKKRMGVEGAAGTWVAIHGFLCLALRHPGTGGIPSRALVEEFVAKLGAALVDAQLLTPEELAEAEDVEIREGPECVRCGCSQDDACEGGCSWDEQFATQGIPVCSRCAPQLRAMEISGRLDPDWVPRLVAQLGVGAGR